MIVCLKTERQEGFFVQKVSSSDSKDISELSKGDFIVLFGSNNLFAEVYQKAVIVKTGNRSSGAGQIPIACIDQKELVIFCRADVIITKSDYNTLWRFYENIENEAEMLTHLV